MRDDSILESQTESETASGWARVAVRAAGALMAVALMAVMVLWSYKLGTRDASDIPVIRAASEVTKKRPEEPGGLEVAHQGRPVYDVVSGQKAEAAAAYAPPAATLAEEDVAAVATSPAPTPRPETARPAAAETPPAPKAAPAVATAPAPDPEPQTEPQAEPQTVAAPEPARVIRVASNGDNQTFLLPPGPSPEALINPRAGQQTSAPRQAPAAESPAPSNNVAAPAAASDLATPLQAAQAPEPASAAAPAEAEAPPPVVQAALTSEGAGPLAAPIARPRPTPVALVSSGDSAETRAAAMASSVQIQLGAFLSAEVAEAQWAAIRSRNGDLLAGRGRVILPVESGGQRLYRLRAGPFDGIDQASSLCRGLKSRGEVCIVARAR